jgi:hypothetical protein
MPQAINPYIKFPVIRIDNWNPKYAAIIKNASPRRKNNNADVIVFFIPFLFSLRRTKLPIFERKPLTAIRADDRLFTNSQVLSASYVSCP